jgi:misacylated tRNA(Ala) deacylase
MATEAVFLEEPYRRELETVVAGVTPEGALRLDRTIFYATSGGQPGDTGSIRRADGSVAAIGGTVTGESKTDILHILAPGSAPPQPGENVTLLLDWERRYRLMRMHTACHLLSVVCPFPVTGAAVAEDDSRIDFDIGESGLTKEDVTARLMELVRADQPVSTQWITDRELAENPSLVKSKNVRPPSGTGRIRLVVIGENGSVDSQPCGGTHVARTGEVGEIHIGKIEKKGRENRRFRIRFGAAPAA